VYRAEVGQANQKALPLIIRAIAKTMDNAIKYARWGRYIEADRQRYKARGLYEALTDEQQDELREKYPAMIGLIVGERRPEHWYPKIMADVKFEITEIMR